MEGTGAKRNVCRGFCMSTGAKFPVAPVESAPMNVKNGKRNYKHLIKYCNLLQNWQNPHRQTDRRTDGHSQRCIGSAGRTIIAKFHYTDTDTDPNGPARTQRSFAAKKSVCV